jgi:hypothetical protein
VTPAVVAAPALDAASEVAPVVNDAVPSPTVASAPAPAPTTTVIETAPIVVPDAQPPQAAAPSPSPSPMPQPPQPTPAPAPSAQLPRAAERMTERAGPDRPAVAAEPRGTADTARHVDAPTRPPPSARVNSARCAEIIQRASLGEEPNAADKSFLTKECRP